MPSAEEGSRARVHEQTGGLHQVADVSQPDPVEDEAKGRLQMRAVHWPVVTRLLYLSVRELMQEPHLLRMAEKSSSHRHPKSPFYTSKVLFAVRLTGGTARLQRFTISQRATDAVERSVRVGVRLTARTCSLLRGWHRGCVKINAPSLALWLGADGVCMGATTQVGETLACCYPFRALRPQNAQALTGRR